MVSVIRSLNEMLTVYSYLEYKVRSMNKEYYILINGIILKFEKRIPIF